jgi:hypothetical protein
MNDHFEKNVYFSMIFLSEGKGRFDDKLAGHR